MWPVFKTPSMQKNRVLARGTTCDNHVLFVFHDPYAPWCWYIYLHLGDFVRANVGKYSAPWSIWVLMFPNIRTKSPGLAEDEEINFPLKIRARFSTGKMFISGPTRSKSMVKPW
jgi:hypothetical protein